MKTNIKLIACTLAITIAALGACKKKDNDSVRARLIGKWLVTQKGTDINRNGVMDPIEMVTTPDTLKAYFTFYDSNTGLLTTDLFGTVLSVGYTWELINNDADLIVKQITGSSTPIGQGSAHIESITATDLTTRDTVTVSGTLVYNWTVLKKQ